MTCKALTVGKDTVVRILSTGKYRSQLDLRKYISLKLNGSIVSFIFMQIYMTDKNIVLAYRSVYRSPFRSHLPVPCKRLICYMKEYSGLLYHIAVRKVHCDAMFYLLFNIIGIPEVSIIWNVLESL